MPIGDDFGRLYQSGFGVFPATASPVNYSGSKNVASNLWDGDTFVIGGLLGDNGYRAADTALPDAPSQQSPQNNYVDVSGYLAEAREMLGINELMALMESRGDTPEFNASGPRTETRVNADGSLGPTRAVDVRRTTPPPASARPQATTSAPVTPPPVSPPPVAPPVFTPPSVQPTRPPSSRPTPPPVTPQPPVTPSASQYQLTPEDVAIINRINYGGVRGGGLF